MATTAILNAPAPVPAPPAAPHESFVQKVEDVFHKDSHAVTNALAIAAKDFSKGLTYLVQYLPEVGALAKIIFPNAGEAIGTATNVVDLIQKSVVAAEAQYSAMGLNTEAGAKKSADVITLVEQTALPLIQEFEPGASTARIQSIIDAVVGVLKAVPVTVPAAA